MNAELELRPFQAAAIQSLRAGIAAGSLRQVLYSPTGSGKSVMATGLIKGARLKNKRVAFLVNRVQLVEQMSGVLRGYGVEHGILQGDNSRREYEPVLVCSIQTIASRGMPDVDFLIIDEGHACAGSKDYRSVIEKATGKPVIALSASPFSKGLGKHYDALGGALFERMVVAASIRELIDDGFLVDCEIYSPGEPDMTGVKQARNAFGEMDWSDMEVGKATDKPELIGDIVSHWQKLAAGTSTVVFASNIAHSKHIVERFKAAGVSAEHIDCYDDTDERRAALKRFEAGSTTIISNASLLAEGWDAPFCQTLILARPTKSLIRYIQMAGRVLRPHPGKERALILDHSGTVKRLGFPTDDLPLELDDGKPKKSQEKVAQDKEFPLPKPCPQCHFLKGPKQHKCPKCGFEAAKQNTVVEHAGELKKLTRDKVTSVQKQQFYSELLGMKVARGYSDGWVSHTYKDKFGVWPKGMQDYAIEPSRETKSFITAKMIRYSKGAKNAA